MSDRHTSYDSTKRCPHCGYANRPSARVCSECLNSLDRGGRSRSRSTHRRTASQSRRSSRADAIRQAARGTQMDQPTQRSRERGSVSSPWWMDWKMGAILLAVLGALGLRHADVPEKLESLTDDADNWFRRLF